MTAAVYRPVTGDLRVSLPYAASNRNRLRDLIGKRSALAWTGRYWTMHRRHFPTVVDALGRDHGSVVVITEHRTIERCHAACREALGTECVCSCLGRHHGCGHWLRPGEWSPDGEIVLATGPTRTRVVTYRHTPPRSARASVSPLPPHHERNPS